MGLIQASPGTTVQVSSRSILGIDLGGTYTRLAAIEPGGGSFLCIHTPAGSEACAVLSEQIRVLLKPGTTPGAIGISRAPGLNALGEVETWPSRPDWHDVPLFSMIQSVTRKLPISADDGACAAVWESLQCDQSNAIVACLTIGTGLGVGIAQNGVMRNSGDGAETISHRTYNRPGLRCKCGKLDCIQIMLSAEGLVMVQTEEMMAELTSGLSNLTQSLTSEYGVDHIVLTGGAIRKFGTAFFHDLIVQAGINPSTVSISKTPRLSSLGGAMILALADPAMDADSDLVDQISTLINQIGDKSATAYNVFFN